MSKCLALVLAAAAVHAADEVRLLKAESRVHSGFGFTWQTMSMDIVVDNLAYEKDVVVWYEGEDGTWKELHAEFVRSYANTDKELWRMSHQWTVKTGAAATTGTMAAVLDLKFAVRYTVNDKTFWDTNNGANYVLAAASGELITSNVFVDFFATPKFGARRTLQVGVFVKNLHYDKVIKVRYSADNWASYKEASLLFQFGKKEGRYSYVTYPNSNGVEYWYAEIDDDSLQADHSTLRFAVRYTVNGETYWDNNYGQDYSRSY